MKSIDTDEVTRLRTAISRLARRLRATEAGGDLTPTQVSVFLDVVRVGSIRVAELAALEGLNPTMLSRVIAVLAEQGLVRRVVDVEDRRAARIEATPAARRLRKRMRRERSATLEPVLNALPLRDREALIAALPALETLAELLRKRPAT
ncbi:MAG TPA: MarR family transcriptional regulator [Gaiellaceae bacterium]|nr:MarR family transcriptional regulator [Gaiellaceae bacterium]